MYDQPALERIALEVIAEGLVRDRERPLTAEEETVGWLLAERLGLTDGLGGMEWSNRVLDGQVSPDAADRIVELLDLVDEGTEERMTP